jgi:V/A-type H+-transporting ATPase subunit C
MTAKAAALMREAAPQPELLDFMLYPVDCVNVKTAIKAQLRGIDCADLLSAAGSVPPDAVLAMVRDRDFSPLPPAMRSAVPAALEDYSKRRDPQAIDLPIDRACFEDMADGAKKCGSPLLCEYVRRRADAVNIGASMRLARSGAPSGLLARTLVPGGAIPSDAIKEAYPDADALKNLLAPTVYGRALKSDIAGTEAALDALVAELFDSVRYLVFGAEVLAAHIDARSREARAARKRSAELAFATAGGATDGEVRKAV